MYFEQLYVNRYKKPFFVDYFLIRQKITSEQRSILKRDFSFYNSLAQKDQARFEHRLAAFMKRKTFVGREDLEVTQDMKILISATAVMLTLGFRNYLINIISVIIIYPKEFFSSVNETHHKGEFNPQLSAIVLSWQHFKEGFDVANDNLNLGIHEFAHAIHFNSMKQRDISSILFKDSFMELTDLLSENESLRKKLITSKYFRAYAYTNQFEFLAVIIESFIETPSDFRSQFPDIYKKTKQMLNFNFAGY